MKGFRPHAGYKKRVLTGVAGESGHTFIDGPARDRSKNSINPTLLKKRRGEMTSEQLMFRRTRRIPKGA